MRVTYILLAMASRSACNNSSTGKAEASEATASLAAAPVGAVVTPAALSFEGASGDAAQVEAHGERLSNVLGCRGCHKPNLEGALFNEDMPEMGKLYASNLTRVVPTMSDAQLEALMRNGAHPTRGEMWIMPSEVFQRLSDADMKALIAHLRTIKPSGEPTPPPVLSDLSRKAIAGGQLKPTAAYVAEFRAKALPDLGERHRWGRYLTETTCAECHGADLTGVPDFGPGVSVPDMDVAGAIRRRNLRPC